MQPYVPGGLVVRIRRFHRRGRGSIPRLGEQILLTICCFVFFFIFWPKHGGVKMCTARESNPSHKNGNLVWYHYTSGACVAYLVTDDLIYIQQIIPSEWGQNITNLIHWLLVVIRSIDYHLSQMV